MTATRWRLAVLATVGVLAWAQGPVIAAGTRLPGGPASIMAPTGTAAAVDAIATGSVDPAPSSVAGGFSDRVAATTNSPRDVERSKILEEQRHKSAAELDAVAATIQLSDETVQSLDAEIAKLAADRGRIRQAMIDAAAAQKAISANLAATEDRIDHLAVEEGTIKGSLRERRGVLSEVLAALERMGRKPPPALLVKPQDALGSVRSAILLGAVVPSIRNETRLLVADLDRLTKVRQSIDAEKTTYATQMTKHREEEARLARLFDEKEKLEASNRDRRAAETANAAELAGKASDLKDLIASLQADAESARAAEEAARKAAAEAEATRVADARKADAARLEAERQATAALWAETQRVAAREKTERLAREQVAMAQGTDVAGQAGTSAVADETLRTAANGSGDRLENSTGLDPIDRNSVPRAEVSGLAGARPGTESPAASSSQGAPANPAATPSGSPTEMASLEPNAGGLTPPNADGGPVTAVTPHYDIDSLRRETARLAPAAPFSTMKGRLSKPVAGRTVIRYGSEDDIGRETTGMSIGARADDVVTAPADATVLYAGPFRSYGQLLILDAGDGYHVVLAGMDRIDVEAGQFVSAGEPVAMMGARRIASVAVAEFGALEPSLYVEFRKDGKPVDPSPWWTDAPSGRTRNDS